MAWHAPPYARLHTPPSTPPSTPPAPSPLYARPYTTSPLPQIKPTKPPRNPSHRHTGRVPKASATGACRMQPNRAASASKGGHHRLKPRFAPRSLNHEMYAGRRAHAHVPKVDNHFNLRVAKLVHVIPSGAAAASHQHLGVEDLITTKMLASPSRPLNRPTVTTMVHNGRATQDRQAGPPMRTQDLFTQVFSHAHAHARATHTRISSQACARVSHCLCLEHFYFTKAGISRVLLLVAANGVSLAWLQLSRVFCATPTARGAHPRPLASHSTMARMRG